MKRISVLIVEDEALVAEDLQQTLTEFGYEAFAIAASADDAIKRTAERCPDVVLMDIRIKGSRDGIETAEIMRTKFHVPVIYLTAHADEATIMRAKKTEPFGYLVKPIRSADLRSAIEIAVYRSELERRARERERWFSTTLRSIADAVVAVDLSGIVTFVNAEAEQLIGLKASDLLGKPGRDVVRLLDDHNAVVNSPLDRAIAERGPVEVAEASLVNASTGFLRAISDSAAPVLDEGRMLGAVMVFRDITDQKRIQRQLELADRLSSLGTMAAGVAHEVNNPLTVIMSNAEFATEDLGEIHAELSGVAVPESVTARLGEIERVMSDIGSAGARIGRIVADLKAFSRPSPTSSAGRANLVEALRWALRSTAHELRLRAKLVLDFDAIPEVVGDEVRLGQVFVNLIMNAAQAIVPGHADTNEVRVSAKQDGDRVFVEVRDTGAGIPDDVRDRIFEPFFTTKSVGGGTGLGLSICHGIVTSMGGELVVNSTPGKGTWVRVKLRVAPPAPAVAGIAEPEVLPTPAHSRILVIDDEPLVLRAIQRMLHEHEVVCTKSAVEALAMIDRGEQYDLILSDLMMPTMSGIELFEQLLQRSTALAGEVVFITGGPITAASEDFLQSIPNERIEKPFAAGALQALVHRRSRR